MNKLNYKILLPALTVGLITAAPLALADDDPAEVKFRQSNMQIFKFYLGPMGAMVKGKIPFDAEIFAAKAEGLATAASLNLLEGFPEGSEGDTNAKGKIWENWSDFEDKFTALQKASAELAKVAAAGDEEATKTQFGKTAKTCKGCHDEYKEH